MLNWACSTEMNIKQVLIDGIINSISKILFMLGWAEHEKGFLTSSPGVGINQAPRL